MRKSIKIGIGVVAGLVIVPLLTALVVTVFFQETIKDRFEAAINAQLSAEVRLQGEASFSFFRYFPRAGISFRDVTIMGGPGFSSDTLLQAGRIAFLFNPFSLYNGRYDVETVVISDGFVRLQTNKGEANYNIWLSDSTSGEMEEHGVDLELADARLENIRLTYSAAADHQFVDVGVDQLQLAGTWTKDQFSATVRTQGTIHQWRMGEVSYLESLPLEIEVTAAVSLAAQEYTLRAAKLRIAGDLYQLEGRLKGMGEAWDTDVSMKGNAVSLGSLIALLPPALQTSLEGWDSEGELDFSAVMKGAYSENAYPGILVDFELQDGTITHSTLKKPITDVVLRGHFTNGSAHRASSSTVTLQEFTGKMGNDPIELQLTVENLAHPQITLAANATLDVDGWAGLLAPLGWEAPTGRIALEEVYIKGGLDDWQSGRYPHRTQARGIITVAALSGTTAGQSWAVPLGQLKLDQHTLAWHDVVLQTGTSDVTTTGACTNFWTYLTQVAQGDTSAVVEIDATLTGEQLNWDDVMAFVPASDGVALDQAVNYLPYFQQYRGVVDVDFRRFMAAPFTANQVRGRIRWSPYLTRLDGLSLETARGTLHGDGFLRVLNNRLVLEGQVVGRGVAIDQVFLGFDNFWQEFIVADNLKGTVDGDIDCSLSWSPDLRFEEEATSIQAKLTIRDGALVDFAPMEDLSDFVKVKELRHIEFSELKNDIRVQGTQVVLPAMQIKSTAMNLWISGIHTFDNNIDYQMQIDLLDVLARKVKLGKMKLEQAEQRQDGLFNLYVTMTGTVDEPVLATDKATVLARFEESRSLLDPTFINFNSQETQLQNKPLQPQDVIDQELDFMDW